MPKKRTITDIHAEMDKLIEERKQYAPADKRHIRITKRLVVLRRMVRILKSKNNEED